MPSGRERSGYARGVAIAAFGVLMYAAGVQGVLRLMLYLTLGPGEAPLVPTARDAALLDGLWVSLFALHHSVMARSFAKRWLWDLLPRPVERSAYVGVSGALLLLLVGRWQPLPGELWDVSGTPLAAAVWTCHALGWGLSIAAVLALDQLRLFGLTGSLRALRGLDPPEEELRERGPYRVIRHPMYTGFVIAVWASPAMDSSRALLAAALTLYAFVGAQLEERDLLARFGEAYGAYRARVPACIPGAIRRGRAGSEAP